MRSQAWIGWIGVVVLVACCQSTPDTKTSTPARDSPLLGLGDRPQQRIWKDWNPATGPVVAPAWIGETVAFDYWKIDDEDVIEATWTSIATMLDSARRDLDDRSQRRTATLLLEALEAEPSALHVDVTFVVRTADARREGFVIRIARRVDEGATPAVALAVLRNEDDAPNPDQIILWAQPSFREARSFTLFIHEAGKGEWSMRADPGLVADSARTPRDSRERAGLFAGVVEKRVWPALTGADYAGAVTRAESASETPEPLEPALGLDTRDRRMDELFTNSAFTPRMDGFDPP